MGRGANPVPSAGPWPNRGNRAAAAALAALWLTAPRAEAAPASQWRDARPVAVVESDYQFTPSRPRFRHGVPYRLHLENHGTEIHTFTAPEFFAAVRIGNPQLVNRARGEVVLRPGAKADLYFVPLRPGRYPLKCSDHDWAGMTGEITIE